MSHHRLKQRANETSLAEIGTGAAVIWSEYTAAILCGACSLCSPRVELPSPPRPLIAAGAFISGRSTALLRAVLHVALHARGVFVEPFNRLLGLRTPGPSSTLGGVLYPSAGCSTPRRGILPLGGVELIKPPSNHSKAVQQDPCRGHPQDVHHPEAVPRMRVTLVCSEAEQPHRLLQVYRNALA